MTAHDWDAKAGRITERLAMEMPRPSALAIPNLRDRISAALAAAYAAGRAESTRETFDVVAYDASNYGDNRCKEFATSDEAIAYARSLEPRFGATAWKRVIVDPRRSRTKLWPLPATPPGQSEGGGG